VNVVEQRTLPIRIRPVVGESLGSWLDRYCFALSATRKELYASVGLRLPATAGQPPDLSLRISDGEAARMASATGVLPADLHRLTMAKYEGRIVVFGQTRQGLDIHFLWARGSGTRYCPACLKEDIGAWQLAWRLTWSFVCTRHRCLMLDLCDGCGSVPRSRRRISDLPLPSFCDNPPNGPYGSLWRCGRDLAQVPLIPISPTSPFLATQLWLNSIINSNDMSSYDVRRLLDDLKLLAGRALRVMTAEDLRSWTNSDMPDVKFEVAPTRGGFVGLYPPGSGVATAHAVTLAAMVLRGDECIYVPIIRRLLSSSDGSAVKDSPCNSVRTWGAPSPGLEQKMLRSIGEDIGPHAALRYRTVGPSPSSPPKDQSQVLARAHSVPQRFWPGWTLRLQMEGVARPKALQTALSIATLLPGSDRSDLKVQNEALGLPLNGRSFTYVFYYLSDPVRRAVMQALLVLASYLDQHPAPIDYQRRRRLGLDQLLRRATWQNIAVDRSISGNPARAARMYVSYRLTGSILGPPQQTGAEYFLVQNFIAATPAGILDLLDEYANAFLRENSITEPLSWEPPFSLLDGILAPRNPDRQIAPAVSDIVKRGLVEPMLIRQLQNRRTRTLEPLRPGIDSLQARVRQALDRGDSVKDMATSLKMSELMVRSHLARLALPTQPEGKIQLTFAEIREMYLIQRLTQQEIADRTGWSRTTIRRLLLRSGVPLRGTGCSTGRRGIDPQKYAEFPALLKDALQSNRGKERLQRFAAISNYTSIAAAARSLGLNKQSLRSQVNVLERSVGSKLLARADTTHPMRLTTLGKRLLDVAREKGLVTSGPANGVAQ
jgi:hypothetical protein